MTRTIEATTLSEGWRSACAALLVEPRRTANHLVIRMTNPLPEDTATRSAANGFVASIAGCQPINEVRNTIFPAELAADFPEPADLVAAYLENYEFIRRLGSAQGTYFGRICAYPRADGTVGRQLEMLVDKLRSAGRGSRLTSRYEINIYAEHRDAQKRMGFPCMAHLAFHLDGKQLDCLSVYRNHDLIRKGYGNYLGLAELQAYLARAAECVPGELTVVAGHSFVDLNRQRRLELAALVAD